MSIDPKLLPKPDLSGVQLTDREGVFAHSFRCDRAPCTRPVLMVARAAQRRHRDVHRMWRQGKLPSRTMQPELQGSRTLHELYPRSPIASVYIHAGVDGVRTPDHTVAMPRVGFADVIKEMQHVDDPDVLDRASKNAAVKIALEMARPRNWWGSGLEPSSLFAIAREEGIPVVWVPSARTLKQLVEAAGEQARRRVLAEEQAHVQADCVTVLAECEDPWLGDDVALCRKAIQAMRAGFHEAAMALFVGIAEPLASWASTPRLRGFKSEADREAWLQHRRKIGKYAWAEYELDARGADISSYKFKQQVLMAPIPRFFTPWFADSGQPTPVRLSRHVVAHHPTIAHFSVENALTALMLVVSILREKQAWSEEVRSMEVFPEEA
jgi:hypothetical protein